jgi:hypothetical protein
MSEPSETRSRLTSDECHKLRDEPTSVSHHVDGRQDNFISREKRRESGIHWKRLSSFVKTSSHHAGSGFVSHTLAQSISYRRKLIKEGSVQYEL